MRFTKQEVGLWLLALLAVALLFVPMPIGSTLGRWPAMARALEDLGHPLLFGLLALLVLKRLHARRIAVSAVTFLWVLGGTITLGAGTEAAQSLVGRDPSWFDLLNDVLGACLVMLLHGRAGLHAKGDRLALAIAAGTIALVIIAPAATTATAYVHRAARMPVLWTQDALLFRKFSHWQHGSFPGLVLDEPLPDWRGWQTLEIDLEAQRSGMLSVIVRMHDERHDNRYQDRYNGTFELTGSGPETLRIPLQHIRDAPAARTMDLSAIRGVIIFSAEPGETAGFTVHEIRLAR